MHTAPLIHLSQLGLLEITGPDSERFLQGQLTCDVIALNDKRWSLGACCTAKGRMVANFVIARTGQTFWLRMPAEQVNALRQHLAKYAVFFKTTLTDRSSEWSVLGSVPITTTPALLNAPQDMLETNSGLALHWPDGRREFWLPNNQAQNSLNTLDAWLNADIQQGLIWVTSSTREEWVPQHIEWQIQGGVSFKKGCYTGQEIVARLQYLGKSKKHVVQLSSEQPLNLAALATVTDNAGKSIGEIATWYNQQGLAVISGEDVPNQILVDGHTLQVSNLFYADSMAQ